MYDYKKSIDKLKKKDYVLKEFLFGKLKIVHKEAFPRSVGYGAIMYLPSLWLVILATLQMWKYRMIHSTILFRVNWNNIYSINLMVISLSKYLA